MILPPRSRAFRLGRRSMDGEENNPGDARATWDSELSFSSILVFGSVLGSCLMEIEID